MTVVIREIAPQIDVAIDRPPAIGTPTIVNKTPALHVARVIVNPEII